MHKALPTPDEHNSSAARCHSPKPDSPPGKRQVLRSPAGTSGMPRPEGPAVSRSLPRPAQRRGAALPFLLRLLLLPATSRGTHLRRSPPRPGSAHRRRLCARRPPRRQAQDPPRRMDRSARGRRAAEGGRGGSSAAALKWSSPDPPPARHGGSELPRGVCGAPPGAGRPPPTDRRGGGGQRHRPQHRGADSRWWRNGPGTGRLGPAALSQRGGRRAGGGGRLRPSRHRGAGHGPSRRPLLCLVPRGASAARVVLLLVYLNQYFKLEIIITDVPSLLPAPFSRCQKHLTETSFFRFIGRKTRERKRESSCPGC